MAVTLLKESLIEFYYYSQLNGLKRTQIKFSNLFVCREMRDEHWYNSQTMPKPCFLLHFMSHFEPIEFRKKNMRCQCSSQLHCWKNHISQPIILYLFTAMTIIWFWINKYHGLFFIVILHCIVQRITLQQTFIFVFFMPLCSDQRFGHYHHWHWIFCISIGSYVVERIIDWISLLLTVEWIKENNTNEVFKLVCLHSNAWWTLI